MSLPVLDGYRTDGPPYRTTPNLIQPAWREADGAAVVLKVHGSQRDSGDEYLAELTALQHYNRFPGGGSVRVVRLLDHDDARRTLVLERVAGRRLDDGWPNARPDAEITALLARTIAHLWATPRPTAGAEGWRDLAAYMRALDRPAPPGVDPDELARAAALARDLRAEPAAAVVLHGDLHHENVIVEDDGTVVVLDPKGVIGAPGFDLGSLLWNPIGRLAEAGGIVALTADRLDVLSDELDRDRSWVAAWGWVVAILGAVWSAEDGHPPDHEVLLLADALNAAAR